MILQTKQKARANFDNLTAEEKRQAIFNMADANHADSTIATATGLSTEYVRQVLGERCH